MIEKGTKIKTKPITYEIEILDFDKPVPAEQEEDFKEWLLNQVNNCSTGKNHEHYGYTNNYKDDIGVTFYIKTV